jgi:carbamoyltransferase
MYILGINAYHGDASACLVKDGVLLHAVEEERFSRLKHSAGFPKESIRFCLSAEQISLNDISYVAINRNPKAKIFNKIKYLLFNNFDLNALINRIKNFRKISNIENDFKSCFGSDLTKKIIYTDHHLCHVASSVFSSNFNNCNYISIDGFGDFVSTTIGYFENNQFFKLREAIFPNSAGVFYSSITQYLGFENYGDEYKVMGLASYGNPIYKEQMSELIHYDDAELIKLNLKYFIHHQGKSEMNWGYAEPKVNKLYSAKFIDLLGPERQKGEEVTQRHKDIAASAQNAYEDLFCKILNKLYKLKKNSNLCISGGCAMNSVANGKVKENTLYENIFINHSPADSGGAIGAAVIKSQEFSTIERKSFYNPYLGNCYSNKEIELSVLSYEKVFAEKNIKLNLFLNKQDLINNIVDRITKKKIGGLFHGKMEFGSRALGNRSIIADPRSADIKDIINLKIKRRENFRPFAPSILEEEVSNWFDDFEDVPYMSKVLLVKKGMRAKIPAVVHINGTGRLQTVAKNLNPFYHDLISRFFKLTSVPILLNTSFNENEPIVRTPEEAIDCFLRTNMDYLVIENYIFYR